MTVSTRLTLPISRCWGGLLLSLLRNESSTPPKGLRDQAETIWQARHKADPTAMSSEDLARLAHDLEVHNVVALAGATR
jgi:hypothetical protein